MTTIWSLWKHPTIFTLVLTYGQLKTMLTHKFWLLISWLIDNANSSLNARNDTPALPASQDTNKACTLLPTILPPRATHGNNFAAARHSVECDDAGIDVHARLQRTWDRKSTCTSFCRDWRTRSLRPTQHSKRVICASLDAHICRG